MTVARQGDADRGATLVEYSLLIALVVVVSLGAISRIQTRGSSKLDDGASDRGRPVEQLNIPANTGVIIGGGSGTSVGSGAANVHLLEGTMVGAHDPGHDWAATTTLKVQDLATGNLWAGVIVTGHWRYDEQQGSGFTTKDIVGTCTTTNEGLCTITLSNLKEGNGNGSVASVRFDTIVLSGPSGSGIVFQQQAGDQTTVGPVLQP